MQPRRHKDTKKFECFKLIVTRSTRSTRRSREEYEVLFFFLLQGCSIGSPSDHSATNLLIDAVPERLPDMIAERQAGSPGTRNFSREGFYPAGLKIIKLERVNFAQETDIFSTEVEKGSIGSLILVTEVKIVRRNN